MTEETNASPFTVFWLSAQDSTVYRIKNRKPRSHFRSFDKIEDAAKFALKLMDYKQNKKPYMQRKIITISTIHIHD